MNLKDLIRKA